MEIERAASTVVQGSSEGAPKEPIAEKTMTVEAPARNGKALSFRDVEGSQQHDLDSMMGDQSHSKSVKAAKESEPEDEEDVELEEDDIPDDSEDDEGDEEGEDDEEEEEQEASSDDEVEKLKKEFDKDGKITVKVNGKEKKYTLAEMKNLVSSGAHTIETYQAFKAEREKFHEESNQSRAEIAFANAKITPAWTAIKEKNIEGALVELAKSADLDTLQVRRHLREQLLPQIVRRLGLSPDEARQRLEENRGLNVFLDTQEENEYYRQERSRLLEQQQQASKPDPSRQAEEGFRALQIEHGISNKDLQWAQEYQNKVATQVGQQPDLRGETLVQLILNRRICDKAIEAIDSVRPRLVKDQAFVDRVVKRVVKNPEWTTSQIARWVYKQAREMSNPSQKETELAKDISKKVLKSKPRSSFESPSAGRNKPMKFSDFGDGGDTLA